MTPDSTSAPRLVLVTQFFPPAVGGSAVLLHNVYSRLGMPVTVLTDAEHSAGPEADPPFRTHRTGIATRHWGLLHAGGLPHHARTARRIRALARPGRAAVHCARVLPEGVAAWMARQAGGPPYVCWSHGEDLATAGLSRDLTLTTKLVLRGAERSLANSRNTAALLERLGVPPEEIRVAHPGVDPSRFRPDVDGSAVRERHASEGDVLLLSVGRLQRRKGHDLVIRALAALRAESPPLRYVIVGTGEEEPRLRGLAREGGVEDRVHFAGQVGEDDLPAYYAACDVFLMPNRKEGEDIEGFGIVFLEAQASARPVIGGTTGGAPEAIADGETGILVEGTDVTELAGALRRLSSSPELRRRLGLAGRERTVREFSWQRAADVVREMVAAGEAKR